MAIIKPFKGIRPAKDKVHLVASRSVDGYSPAQLTSKLSENPYSFLHVIKPEFKESSKAKAGTLEQLQKIKVKFLQFVSEGYLFQDKEESIYIYQQIQDGHAFTGIIACSSIWDYYSNVIKIHEQTISDREEKLKTYLEVCDFNAEPVCLSYPDNKAIDEVITKATSQPAEYDFTTTDKIRHKLWVINNKATLLELERAFEKLPAVYIADGHHRTASSALLGKMKKKNNPNHTGNEPYNFFLSVIFPERDLKIYEFNRIIKDLNFLSKETFLRKLSQNFEIKEIGKTPYKPAKKGDLSLYIEETWYSVSIKAEVQAKPEMKDKLDVEILSDLILAPLLDIHDLKTDKRVAFVSGTKGIAELTKTIDDGKAMAGFVLHPLSMHDIIKVADAGGIMPPKSTWVEPKMRSGLVVYSLSPSI